MNLTGTTIVLAHPRTGSSLLMQTLRLLGQEVVGEAERPDLPAEANPRGYFEDRELLSRGLQHVTLEAAERELRGRAVKLALSLLVLRSERAETDEWRQWAESGARLLLPIRSPTEALQSVRVFDGVSQRPRDAVTGLAEVRRRLCDFGFLARWCGEREEGVGVVDYAMAIADPSRYVERVARLAVLTPTEAQRAEAVRNISADLHRFRRENASEAARAEMEAARLEQVYRALRDDAPGRWTRAREALPEWALRSGGSLDGGGAGVR